MRTTDAGATSGRLAFAKKSKLVRILIKFRNIILMRTAVEVDVVLTGTLITPKKLLELARCHRE